MSGQRFSCLDDDLYHDKTQEQYEAEGFESCGVLLRCKTDKDVYLLLDEKKGEAIPLRTD